MSDVRHGNALAAGAAYFTLVFALGFVLGVVRTLAMTNPADESERLIAVLIELPVMLLASWFACRWLVRRMRIASDAATRVTMGLVALALLLTAEAGLGILLLGRTLTEHMSAYRLPSNALGLAAQIGFASMPWLESWRERMGAARKNPMRSS
jgi:hypothetical protein